MRTNIDIDDDLMEAGFRITGKSTKREVVNEALRRLTLIDRQTAMRGLWGLGWDGDLDAMRADKVRPADG